MFEKIKNIFKRIFGKQKVLELQESKVETKVKTNNLKQDLKENLEIYNTQKMYEEGKVTENELQISQIRQLINLYKEQINVLDTQISMKKAKL